MLISAQTLATLEMRISSTASPTIAQVDFSGYDFAAQDSSAYGIGWGFSPSLFNPFPAAITGDNYGKFNFISGHAELTNQSTGQVIPLTSVFLQDSSNSPIRGQERFGADTPSLYSFTAGNKFSWSGSATIDLSERGITFTDLNLGTSGPASGFPISGQLTVSASTRQTTPKTFGLFIGINDIFATGLPLYGGTMASKVMGAFATLPGFAAAKLMTADFGPLSSKPAFTAQDIEASALALRKLMNPGDTLVVYFDGHGSDLPGYVIGPKIGQDLSNQEVAEIFQKPDFDSVNKLFLLDFCFSGSWWQSTAIQGLDSIPLAAMISAAKAGDTAWYSAQGVSQFSSNLLEALAKGSDGFFAADYDHDGRISAQELGYYLEHHTTFWQDFEGKQYVLEGDTVYIQGAGDSVRYDSSLRETGVNGNLSLMSVSSVPEVDTMLMLSLGLVMVFGIRLRHLVRNG